MSNAPVSPLSAVTTPLSAMDSLSVKVGQSDLFTFFIAAMLEQSSRTIDDARKGIVARLFKDHARNGESGNDLALRLPGFKSCRAYSSLVAKATWTDLVDSSVTVASLSAKLKGRNKSPAPETAPAPAPETAPAAVSNDETIARAMMEYEMGRLEAEVARLEAEVARLKAENAVLKASAPAPAKVRKSRQAA